LNQDEIIFHRNTVFLVSNVRWNQWMYAADIFDGHW